MIRRVKFQYQKFVRDHQENRHSTRANLVIEAAFEVLSVCKWFAKPAMISMQISVDKGCLMAVLSAIGVDRCSFFRNDDEK